MLALILFIVLIVSVIYFSLSSEKPKTIASPFLKFDAQIRSGKGLNTRITLDESHLNRKLLIPKINSSNLNDRKKGKRSLSIILPALTKSHKIIIQEPRDDHNKSSLIEIKNSNNLLFFYDGKYYEKMFLWQQVGGGDVEFRHIVRNGLSYWTAIGGTNLKDTPILPPTAQNIVSTIGSCVGSGAAFGSIFLNPDASGQLSTLGSAANSAANCADGILSCIMGVGPCGDDDSPPPPLTNADIQRDMQIVLDRQLDLALSAAVTTTWNNVAQNEYSVANYLADLRRSGSGQGPGITYNLISEYGFNGDPEVLLSLSSNDADYYRTQLVSADTVSFIGKAGCTGASSRLCGQISTYEAIGDIFLTNTSEYPYENDPVNQALFWPFMTQMLSSYMVTLREIAQKSTRKDGNGNYVSPWENLAGDGNVYQNVLKKYLPLAYQFYNKYVQEFQSNIVWEQVQWNATNLNSPVSPDFQSNYCAWGGTASDFDENGSPMAWSPAYGNTKPIVYIPGFGPTVNPPFYSLVNNNYLTSNSTVSMLLPEWNQNNFSASLFSEQPNYAQNGFPGFGVVNSIERFIAPYSGDPLAYFCQTSTAGTDTILSATRLSATEWLHEHNSYPFSLYDLWALEAGLSCSALNDGTGQFTCTTIGTTFTEGNLEVSSFAPFGSSNGYIQSTSQRGTYLMVSDPANIEQNMNATITFDNSVFNSFSNGFPFDASAFSSSGWFDIPSTMCCPAFTQQVQGVSILSVSESPGNAQDPVKKRQLFCVESILLGNNSSVSGFSGPAEECIPTIIQTIQYASATSILTNFSQTGYEASLVNATSKLGSYPEFFSPSLPLRIDSSGIYTFTGAYTYETNSQIASFSCPVGFYSTLFGENGELLTTGQTVSIDFGFGLDDYIFNTTGAPGTAQMYLSATSPTSTFIFGTAYTEINPFRSTASQVYDGPVSLQYFPVFGVPSYGQNALTEELPNLPEGSFVTFSSSEQSVILTVSNTFFANVNTDPGKGITPNYMIASGCRFFTTVDIDIDQGYQNTFTYDFSNNIVTDFAMQITRTPNGLEPNDVPGVFCVPYPPGKYLMSITETYSLAYDSTVSGNISTLTFKTNFVSVSALSKAGGRSGAGFNGVLSDGLRTVSNNTCSINSANQFLYNGSVPIQEQTQAIAYNFSFVAAIGTNVLPTTVTVSDGTSSILVTQTTNLNNYNYGGPLLTGICSTSVCRDDGPNNFAFYENLGSNGEYALVPATNLLQGSEYVIRVYEFVDTWKDAPVNEATCVNEPYAFCNPCPLLSEFSKLNWSGYTETENGQVPPSWRAQFSYVGLGGIY